MPELWIRSPFVRAFDLGEELIAVAPDGHVHRFEREIAPWIRTIWSWAEQPRSYTELQNYLCSQVDAEHIPSTFIEALLSSLEASGTLIQSSHSRQTLSKPQVPSPPKALRLVLCITGAVAASYAPMWVHQLLQEGYIVRVIATPSALQFVQKRTLEALTHTPVFSSIWEGEAHRPALHIEYAQWADLVLVYPSSATTLSRIASGDCSTLVSAVAVATSAPVVCVPSMNPSMYTAPSVQRTMQLLREDGHCLIFAGWGVEVAECPSERKRLLGAAPPHTHVAELLHVLIAMTSSKSDSSQVKHAGAASPSVLPPGVASASPNLVSSTPETFWDAIYADESIVREGSWFSDEPDPDFLFALESVDLPARVLEVGTGWGQLARALAQKGLHVVALDCSQDAITYAQNQDPELPIVWMCEDVVASSLCGPFEIVVDRGFMHLLSPEESLSYIRKVHIWLKPGSLLLFKIHAETADLQVQTQRYTQDSFLALWRTVGAFECVEWKASHFVTEQDQVPAFFVVLRAL